MSDEFAARIALAKRNDAFAGLVDSIPYAGFLGFSLTLADGGVLGRLEFAARNIGNSAIPALHGGTLAGLMELTALFELLWRTEVTRLPKVIGCTIEYLRSGRPETTFASARIVRQGRRVAPLRVTAWQSDRDKPIAEATVHYLVG